MTDILVFIVILIGIIIDVVVATSAQKIAEMKGHTSTQYFWYTFILMPVGLAFVIALPDLYARPAASAPVKSDDEPLPEL